MQAITQGSIAELLKADDREPKVTIYLPMHTTASPPHIAENQIRFKNLIHAAIAKLRNSSEDKQVAALLNDQIETYMDDLNFWESQTEGLLICAEPQNITLFHLPIDTEEYMAVDTSYHLAPILGLIHDEQPFYVLAVAQHQPKLFAGSMYGLCDTEVPLPVSITDSLRIDEHNQKREQSQSSNSHGSFNARGGNRDSRQEERLRFFRMIDETVCGAVERSTPIVLAGTEQDVAEYTAISKHPNLAHATIQGSFGGAKAHQLFKEAYSIIHEELVKSRRDAALKTYNRIKGTQKDRVVEDPLAIAEAAKQGRIDTLIVALRRTTTDTVRDTLSAVERITFPTKELSTLINKAAGAVATASGKVLNLELEAIPGNAPVAAVLRY